MCFFVLTSSSPVWFLCALVAIVANVCFGASMVCLNAYLSGLARGMPECVAARGRIAETELQPVDEGEDAIATTTASTSAWEDYCALVSRTTSFISARGIAAGYIGGIIALLIALLPVSALKGSTLSLRLAIGISGVWWFLFTIRMFFFYIRPRAFLVDKIHFTAPALWLRNGGDAASSKLKHKATHGFWSGWTSLGRMLRHASRLRNTFWFLLAWFILSDGEPSLLLFQTTVPVLNWYM
jgi:UMF1 family MFS transporter